MLFGKDRWYDFKNESKGFGSQYNFIVLLGLLNLRIHKKAELILISKDNNDRQMCHGGLTIVVEIKYKDTSSRLIPVRGIQVGDKRDGTYIISFIPDAAGIMILTININGKPVKVICNFI